MCVMAAIISTSLRILAEHVWFRKGSCLFQYSESDLCLPLRGTGLRWILV